MKSDALGDRMKRYENVTRTYLTRRIPAVIRVDGKAFHTLTRGMEKPFDAVFTQCMLETAKFLCSKIEGAKLAYVQSDEITLLLTDYATRTTEAYFDYNILKLSSTSAGYATQGFLRALLCFNPDKAKEYLDLKSTKECIFDSRAFSIPKEEVVNCLIWRQQDATRNSILAIGQYELGKKAIYGLKCPQIQEKLFQEKKINWNDYPTGQKRGYCIVKETYEMKLEDIPEQHRDKVKEPVIRTRWVADLEIPIFTASKNYVEKYL